MTLHLEVLTGARAGRTARFEVPPVIVGRDPECDLQLGPELDLAVSARHARLDRDAGGWFVRDLDSRNGTIVDGERIRSDRYLRDGDRLELGRDGPEVRVRIAAAESGRGGSDSGLSPTRQLRRQLSEKLRGWKILAGLLALLLVGVLLSALYVDARRRAELDRQRSALESRMDSLLDEGDRALDSAQVEVEGLREALTRSRSRIADLRSDLRSADASGADAARVAELERRLQAATTALRRQQLAASVDFSGLEEANWRSLAQVYAERPDGSVVTGTAFAVRPDGLMITAGHIVEGRNGGGRATRLAVQFAASRQVWPATVEAMASSADLALLRVRNVAGEVPTVSGFNARVDTLAAGTPVALMGYPLGGSPGSSGEEGGRLGRPLLVVGIVERAVEGRLRVQGYGERGASGSPIFDAGGEVVGVLLGGQVESGVRVLTGESPGAAEALLEAADGG